MPSLFSKALSGVHVPHCKNTADCQAISMPVPEKVVIPMLQHMGVPCNLTVKVGDTVTVGQKIGDSDAFLTSPVYSSVSGTVTAIIEFVTMTGGKCQAAEITADRLQTPCSDLTIPTVENQQDLIKAARACGLVGLGGAGFPTHIKLNPKSLDAVDTLAVNGAECEPFITTDMRVMLDRVDDLFAGLDAVKKHLNIANVVIGIEDNKPECIKKLSEITAGKEGYNVKTLRSIYPQGGEKVLVYETTGRVVKEGMLPADVGVIVMNVTSAAKLGEYLRTGMPLVEKTITVDGGSISEPKNVTVPIGTSIKDIAEFCGGYQKPVKKILMGGPMMGAVVVSESYPLLKNNNAIIFMDEEQARQDPETACIRCGRCLRACPFDLSPAALDRAYHQNDVEALKQLKVNLCMECGCCSYVCPAKRNLVMYNKMAKKLLREAKK